MTAEAPQYTVNSTEYFGLILKTWIEQIVAYFRREGEIKPLKPVVYMDHAEGRVK